MKIECNPEFNVIEKSVKLNLNDEQWDILRMSKFSGLWFFLRWKGGE